MFKREAILSTVQSWIRWKKKK